MEQQKGSTKGGGFFVFFLVGLLGSLAVGWFVYPQVLFSEKAQPINFSHRVHVEDVAMACEDCHYFREDGSYAGYPTTEQCAECHMDVTEGESEAEKEMDKFVIEYVETGKEVEWLTYQYQPDNVYFSHQAHYGFECTDCHPDVGNSETPPPYKENILTGYSKDTMKMWKCEQCHAESGVSNACYICHK